jgi:hypothetical protein
MRSSGDGGAGSAYHAGMSQHDLPAPRWVVDLAEWLSQRWLFPVGMTRVWTFAGGEREMRTIFGETVSPVKWGHLFGRPYRPDCDALIPLQPASGLVFSDTDRVAANIND